MAKEGTAEAELHCVVRNERARRFYARGLGLQRKLMEQVGGEHEQVDVPFCLSELSAVGPEHHKSMSAPMSASIGCQADSLCSQ